MSTAKAPTPMSLFQQRMATSSSSGGPALSAWSKQVTPSLCEPRLITSRGFYLFDSSVNEAEHSSSAHISHTRLVQLIYRLNSSFIISPNTSGRAGSIQVTQLVPRDSKHSILITMTQYSEDSVIETWSGWFPKRVINLRVASMPWSNHGLRIHEQPTSEIASQRRRHLFRMSYSNQIYAILDGIKKGFIPR